METKVISGTTMRAPGTYTRIKKRCPDCHYVQEFEIDRFWEYDYINLDDPETMGGFSMEDIFKLWELLVGSFKCETCGSSLGLVEVDNSARELYRALFEH